MKSRLLVSGVQERQLVVVKSAEEIFPLNLLKSLVVIGGVGEVDAQQPAALALSSVFNARWNAAMLLGPALDGGVVGGGVRTSHSRLLWLCNSLLGGRCAVCVRLA